MNIRDGNLILTALAIGRVLLINATKSLGFVLAQVVLTLEWASAYFQPCEHAGLVAELVGLFGRLSEQLNRWLDE